MKYFLGGFGMIYPPPRPRFTRINRVFFFLALFPAVNILAQSSGGNVVVISDTSTKASPGASQTVDRLTLLDGSVLIGKITEMSATRVVIKMTGTEFVVDPARIEKVERNIASDALADRQRPVLITTKDGSKYRGSLKRADATNTYILSGGSEIPVRNDNIENIEYLDAEKARQSDQIAARPPKWEITIKGGSMFYQLGTYKDLLSPGYFGLLQVQYPSFLLPKGIRLTPGLQTGYLSNSGKSVSTTRIDLFPGTLTFDVSWQIPDTRFDIFAAGLIGVNLTRVTAQSANERLSLDLAYGAEMGGKFYISPLINVRLSGIWLAISESGATLNHLGAYAGVGFMF
ncbi:MAG: hypothetical protein U1F40_03870 [Turneriella sp.]